MENLKGFVGHWKNGLSAKMQRNKFCGVTKCVDERTNEFFQWFSHRKKFRKKGMLKGYMWGNVWEVDHGRDESIL